MDSLTEVNELDAGQLQAVRDLADLLNDRSLRYEFLAVVNAAAVGKPIVMSERLYLEVVGGLVGAHAENVKLTRALNELEARHQEAVEAVEAERLRANMLENEVRSAGLMTTKLSVKSLAMTSKSMGVGNRPFSH